MSALQIKSGDTFRDNRTGRRGRTFTIAGVGENNASYTGAAGQLVTITIARLSSYLYTRVAEASNDTQGTSAGVPAGQAEQLGTINVEE